MMPVILNQVLSLLQAQGALFVREDPVAKDMVLEYAVGAWTPARGKRIPGNRGISAQVLKTGQPYLTNHASEDPVLIRSYFLGDLEYAACVPLSTQRQTVGAIWIGKSSELGSNDMRIMMAIANMAASAFHRAQLFDQTQLRLHRLMSLHSIDMAITSSLDIRVTLSMLLDQVTTQLHADAADVLLYRPETKTLEFAAGRGFIGSQIKETILEYGEGYAGRAAKERNVIHVPDLTQDLDQETARILRASEEGFRAYFAAPLIAKGQVNGVLEIFNRSPMYPDPEWKDFLETLATQAAIAVDNAELFEDLQLTNEELSLAYDATIEGWSHALELRDHETQGHSRRVTDLSLHLAHAMHLPDDQMNDFRRGVLLHDIGKMGIPDSILLKPGHLTDNEWRIMRRHPEYAFDMLAPIPYLRKSLEVPYSHHERWNGSGYPRGLKGEQIPFEARIFAVVDVYDALVSDRPYRRAWPEEKVRDYLKEKSGVEFDPHVVDTFLRLNIDGHNGKNHQKKDH
jgi:HD-GYP domain-containing protein (c-di-GMP phosphodiesterase class II)